MKVHRIKEILNAEILCGEEKLDYEVDCASGSDLMSQVLKFPKENSALLTGLNNLHVIRTAEMLDIQCVIFVRGIVPGEDIVDDAESMGMILLKTNLTLYESCGRLYKEGLGDENT